MACLCFSAVWARSLLTDCCCWSVLPNLASSQGCNISLGELRALSSPPMKSKAPSRLCVFPLVVFPNLKAPFGIQYYGSRYECFLISMKMEVYCCLFSVLFSIGLQKTGRGAEMIFLFAIQKLVINKFSDPGEALGSQPKIDLSHGIQSIVWFFFFFPLVKSTYPSS